MCNIIENYDTEKSFDILDIATIDKKWTSSKDLIGECERSIVDFARNELQFLLG